jgi:hypothetical protein
MSEPKSYETVLVVRNIVCPALTLTSPSPELEERVPECLSLNLMRLF